MSETTPSSPALSFDRLVTSIGQAHAELAAQSSRAVNASLTLRNWLIGFHIEEYERRGVDRQQYGEKLLDRLSESLTQKGVSRCDRRELYRYRQFYLTYPQIVESLPPQLAMALPAPTDAGSNRESPAPKLGIPAHTTSLPSSPSPTSPNCCSATMRPSGRSMTWNAFAAIGLCAN